MGIIRVTIWKFPSITVRKMGEMYLGPRIIIGTHI